ncbi:IS1096 element passenger TnpR family protein [Neobacillus cucumis]|uniref:IS1096 element passenger TnpR family protein n=1 Tax=Neobacillus cucumis TaxID=1740721 RepID=UPI0035A94654
MWRRLLFPSGITFQKIIQAAFDLQIQRAFDFDDAHLYDFYMDGKKYSKRFYNSPMDIHGPFVNEVTIDRR